MKKRILAALALVVTGSLALSGCAGRVQEGANGNASHAHLTYGMWDKDQAIVVKKLAAEYEKTHPGITIDVEVTPVSQYWTKLRTEATSGTAPDIVTMNGPQLPLYAAFDQLEPIDSSISAKKIDTTKYPRALVDMYRYNGKQYGVPKDYDVSALAYDKKLFQDAGEALPTDDWTWEDLRTAAKRIREKLKGRGDYGFAAPLAGQGGYWDAMYQAGGSPLKNGQPNYTSEGSVKGIEQFRDLIEDGSSPTSSQLTDTPALSWMISGKSAMAYVPSYQLVELRNADRAKDIGFVRMPREKERAAVIHGLANVIMKSSQNKAAAEGFVEFLAGEHAQKVWGNSQTIIPARAGTSELWTKGFATQQWDLTPYMKAAAEDARPYPVTLTTGDWSKTTDAALQSYYANGGDAHAVAQKCDDLIAASLREDKKLSRTKQSH